MRAVRSLVVAVLAVVVVATPSVALADGRVALVVGNSTYAHIGRLFRRVRAEVLSAICRLIDRWGRLTHAWGFKWAPTALVGSIAQAEFPHTRRYHEENPEAADNGEPRNDRFTPGRAVARWQA